MPVRLKNHLNRLQHSFGFVPTLFAVGALILGYGVQRLDLWLYGDLNWELTDPAGARAILTTVAGSAITVAGVVYSITMVVLSTASTQFGPRLIRNFMRHKQTKVVLGGFIATFIYCLLVTATVRDGVGGWTPQIAVTTGGAFGVLSFGLLISFIHHTATYLQAPRIIGDVVDRLHEQVGNLYPYSALPKDKHSAVRAGKIPNDPGTSRPLHFPKEGYLQAVDLEGLLELAEKNNALVKLHFKPAISSSPAKKSPASGKWATAGRRPRKK